MKDWSPKLEWKKSDDKTYCVIISRHEVILSPDPEFSIPEQGKYRWCVYAYIYTTHPHFKNFAGNDMWQEASRALPLHAGASLLHWHRNDDGKITSVQIGSDYNHLYDDSFTRAETKEDAYGVFADAERLIKWLEETRDDPGKIAQDEARKDPEGIFSKT